MSYLEALRKYVIVDPTTLGPGVILKWTESTITIFDGFPKALYHFLVLPRVGPSSGLTMSNVASLRDILQWDRVKAQKCLEMLRLEAQEVKKMIEDEMVKTHGFTWPVFIGLHAVPSMKHLHLHVLSDDLCSPKLKHKKHYNSFHPKLGFFLHIDEIMEWFELPSATPFVKGVTYESKTALNEKVYDPLLKEDLSCFKCGQDFKFMPKLKDHLQEEWETEKKRAKTPDPELQSESMSTG